MAHSSEIVQAAIEVQAPATGPTPSLAAAIMEKLQIEVERSRSSWIRRHPIASDAPGPGDCLRRQQLIVLHPEETQPSFDTDLLLRFERGRHIGGLNARKLGELGFEVVETERHFELRTDDGETVLVSGKVDCRVRWNGTKPPVEIKSVSPHMFERLHSSADMERWPWTRKYLWQLQLYMRFCHEEYGLLLLDDCLGHWRIIEVQRDDDLIRDLLENCQVVMAGVEAVRHAEDEQQREAELAGYHRDPAVCRECPCYGRVCAPPMISVLEGEVEVVEDPEVSEELETWRRLKQARDDFEAIDRRIKERFRGKSALVGNWYITGQWQARATYDIPQDIKERFKRVNDKAAWVMDIKHLGGQPVVVGESEAVTKE